MPSVSFTIPGKPVGYLIIAGKFYGGERKQAYLNYKKTIQLLMPRELRDLVATRDHPVQISTKAFFVDGNHPDPENVHKGAKDAIFYKKKNGDKYTGGLYDPPLYDKENPRLEIEVVW